MADSVGRHVEELLAVTYDDNGEQLGRRILFLYDEDDGESPLSTRHGEPPPKKPKLSKEDAATDDATQAPVGEHRLRKEARRLLALRKQRRKQQQQ